MLNIMKRITLFFLLAAFSPFVSQAQYSHLYYHCQRDTIIGDAEKAGYRKVRGKAEVNAKTGSNSFEANDDGPHAYLVKTKEDRFYKKLIDEILMTDDFSEETDA